MQLCNGARVPTIKPITEHMEMNMAKTVWVLGANGRLGRAVALAFAAAGWRVRAPWRHGAVAQAPALPGVQWLAPGAALQAALDEGADAVVHAMNPARYTASAWRTEAPALLHQAITTALALRAVLLFPGNVYNFGAGMPAVLDAHTPQRPSTPLGQVRVALEQQLAQAVATQGLRAVIVRAGDFFGAGQGTWLDLVIARKLRQGVMTWPGPLDVPHAWAYLPDLAQAFVRVAAAPAPAPGQLPCLPFAGHTTAGHDWQTVLSDWAQEQGWLRGGALRVQSLPWGWMRLATPVVPMLRSLQAMRYLWQVPHALDGTALARYAGPVPHTPLREALRASLALLDGAAQPATTPATTPISSGA
jgi:nucleoside-diphosphate-sugar epimerase